MHRRVPFLLFPSLLFAACAAPSPAAAVDAAWQRSAVETTAFVPCTAIDPVVAQLAHAFTIVSEARRRVAVENLANVDSCGWKRRIVRTTTQTIGGADGAVHTIPVLLGIDALFTQGALLVTQRNLDLAIDGDGFFAVTLGDGTTGYTRAGAFAVNNDGKIVDREGRCVQPEITVPTDTLEIAIDPEGRFNVRTASSPDTSSQIGQLTLHRFVNPSGLRCDGSVWKQSDESGASITSPPGYSGNGILKQGFLESSNVDAARAMFDLQVAERQQQSFAAVLRQLGLTAP